MEGSIARRVDGSSLGVGEEWEGCAVVRLRMGRGQGL